jgi:RNA polymerase sigma-70 factor (ECF subfamily)
MTEADEAAQRRAQDARHARLATAGDAEAFRALVLRYQGPLLAVLRDELPAADREDVAQDAFVSAWSHIAAFDPDRGAFFTWLVRIARNRAANVRRKRAPRSVAELPQRESRTTADEGAVREEEHRRLDAALASLPAEQRAAFVLAEIHELPLADVAALADVPVGTVKSRVARARAKLRASLSQEIAP